MLRIISTFLFLCCTVFLLACPQQTKQTSQKINYNDAETRLRLAINVNEMAYTSWNHVYENFGQLKKDGKLSEARWASIAAIDSVIVLTEAELIDGIDRSKKLLETWRKSSVNLLTAESPNDVVNLREKELDALHSFKESIKQLNVKSLKLRDSYAEAMMVTDKAIKEGLAIPQEHALAIRQVIQMVDFELNGVRPPQNAAAKQNTNTNPGTPAAIPVK
jgi:hypothetical protein